MRDKKSKEWDLKDWANITPNPPPIPIHDRILQFISDLYKRQTDVSVTIKDDRFIIEGSMIPKEDTDESN